MRILRINGFDAVDELDLFFMSSLSDLTMDIMTSDGQITIRIRKRETTNLGITTQPLVCRPCGNRCIFCFADQNPAGCRETLRFKDEDYRFSFLFGHYVTLSHVTDREIDRIVRLRLHPIYISIHTTSDTLRRKMMGVKKSYSILSVLDRLKAGQLTFHGQIVVCPGWNDGAELTRTIRDLVKYTPNLESLPVIPVGLTDHRMGLTRIDAGSREWAGELIEQIQEIRENVPNGWLACSDEMFLRAGMLIPLADYYGGFPQIENGVGMLREMIDRGNRKRRFDADCIDSSRSPGREVWVMTGIAAYPTLHALIERWFRMSIPSWLHVAAVRNTQLGDSVTVCGLVCGSDLIRTLGDLTPGSGILIPSVMLRDAQDRFLDDLSVADLEAMTGATISVIEPDVDSLYNVLRSIVRDRVRNSDRASDPSAVV